MVRRRKGGRRRKPGSRPPLILHPCLCEKRFPTYRQYQKHRRLCSVWKNRPNPRGLALFRRLKRFAPTDLTAKAILAVPEFRRVLRKNDLNPHFFAAFLRLLKKRVHRV